MKAREERRAAREERARRRREEFPRREDERRYRGQLAERQREWEK